MTENNNKKLFKYRMLTPLWIAIFIDVLGFTIFFPMVGFFSELFNTSMTMIGLIFSVNAMFGFAFGPILAKLSDKYGRRPLLLISQFSQRHPKVVQKSDCMEVSAVNLQVL